MSRRTDSTGIMNADPATLESRIGYCFRDASLLALALTHPSYSHEHREATGDYQRLEFLGDAVLNLILAEQLYRDQAEADEGTLTVLRSQCASGRALSEIAQAIDLGTFLRFGKGDDAPAKRLLQSNLAASMEALLGAAWMDGGLEAARAIYLRLFHGRVAALEQNPWAQNPKGELQAWMQARNLGLPVYAVATVEGPTHDPRFCVAVEIDGLRAIGHGGSKQRAEADAARAWLDDYRQRYN